MVSARAEGYQHIRGTRHVVLIVTHSPIAKRKNHGTTARVCLVSLSEPADTILGLEEVQDGPVGVVSSSQEELSQQRRDMRVIFASVFKKIPREDAAMRISASAKVPRASHTRKRLTESQRAEAELWHMQLV